MRSDVLVIGLGPAGAAAAISAARLGARVCVVDQAWFPRPKTCGDALSNDGVRMLGSLGCDPVQLGLPHATVPAAAVVLADGTQLERDYEDQPGLIVPRLHLDLALRNRARELGCELNEGVRIERLLREHGRVCGARGGGRDWKAATVVVADGSNSVAWAAVPARKRRAGLAVAVTAYVTDLAIAVERAEHFLSAELPGGYGWVFPPVDGVSNVGVLTHLDALRCSRLTPRELLRRFLSRRAAQLAGARIVGQARTATLPLATGSRLPIEGGLLVCGDAARLVDPLTGEGIWQALKSGAAAGALAAAAAPRGGVSLTAAARYAVSNLGPMRARLLLRSGIRSGLDAITAHLPAPPILLRELLRRGYGCGISELTKTVRRSGHRRRD